MNLKTWLLDKKVYFIVHLSATLMLLTFMSVFGMNKASVIFVALLSFLSHGSYLAYEYFRRYRFYKEIDEIMDGLDKKYYIDELMPTPFFFEGLFLYDLISAANKAMNDEIYTYKNREKDYRDYIETWIHEVKTPIAASHLILKNNPGPLARNIREEVDKIENYVEQALYYARGTQLEKDYIIKSLNLKKVVQDVLKRNAKLLIGKKCQINLFEKDVFVKADEKWIAFILHQLMMNSIQYSSSPMRLDFGVENLDNEVIFWMKDYGSGISSSDIKRVFQKGFTGVMGRRVRTSTGIGLYLCQQLCHKMGLKISIESEKDSYTQVNIRFPLSGMYR